MKARWSVLALAGAIAGRDAAAEPRDSEARYAVGYQRGIGLGYFGSSFAIESTPRVAPTLMVFALAGDGQRGFALAPSVQLKTRGAQRSSPYVSLGMQYIRAWYGDVAGGGFGGFATFGYELRLASGLAFQLGLGLHGKQAINGREGVVSVMQAANFGPHWDAGVRFWF